MAHFKLKQKNHSGEDLYYFGSGSYYGLAFEQVGEELVTEGKEEDLDSLVKAKKVIKLSAAAYKELKEEAE